MIALVWYHGFIGEAEWDDLVFDTCISGKSDLPRYQFGEKHLSFRRHSVTLPKKAAIPVGWEDLRMKAYRGCRFTACLLALVICLNLFCSAAAEGVSFEYRAENDLTVDAFPSVSLTMDDEKKADSPGEAFSRPMDRSAFPESLTVYDSAASDPQSAETSEILPGTEQRPEIVAYQNEAERRWLSEGGTAARRGRLTIAQLRQKYPAGKYWNHAGNPGCEKIYNNDDGVSEVPCPENHTDLIGTEFQTCNSYFPGDYQIGVQCYGYAYKLGYEATGIGPETWEKREYSGALNSLKTGDIVRYRNNQHSIFVIAVDGENVIYTECNEGGTCVIRWDKSITKSEISQTFSWVNVCPESLSQDTYCYCSATHAGYYTCTANSLPVYSSHSLSGSTLGTVSGGSTVNVLKACGRIAHINYNGYVGYVDSGWLSRQSGFQLSINWTAPNIYLTIPDDNSKSVTVTANQDIPNGYYFYATFGSGLSLQWDDWINARSQRFHFSSGRAEDGVISISLRDNNGNAVAFYDIAYRVQIARASLAASASSVTINGDDNEYQTISLTAGGFLPDSISFVPIRCTNDIIYVDWPGEWDGTSHAMRIKGVYLGNTTLIVGLKCQNVIRATAAVNINVEGTSHINVSKPIIYLNRNGAAKRKYTVQLSGMTPRYFSLTPKISTDAFSVSNAGDYYTLDGYPAIDIYVTGLKDTYGYKDLGISLTDAKADKEIAQLNWPVYVWDCTFPAADFTLPSSLQKIDQEAFLKIKASVVRLPKGLKSIGKKAFADCEDLTSVYIPSSVKTIDSSAFDLGSERYLMVYGAADSVAEDFAINHRHWFIPVE